VSEVVVWTWRRQSRRVRAAGMAGLAVAAALAAGCGRQPAAANSEAAASGAAAVAVTVAPAASGDISRTVDVTGSLVALQDVTVGTRAPGRVAAVFVREGDPVRAGQVVATMDSTDPQAGVQQAQASLDAAFTREQQARAALQQARIAVTQARNQLRNAEVTLRWTDRTSATAVEVARAGLQSAQEALSVVKQGAREQERRQAEENVRSAKATYEKARADLRRSQDLYREQAVSQSQLDQAQAAFEAAQAQYNSAQQALSLIREGARPEEIRRAELAVQQARESLAKAEADRATVELRRQDVENARASVQAAEAGLKTAQAGVAQARAGVDQARAALRIAQEGLRNAYITSPITGYVADRIAEPGAQLGGGGPVMRIVAPGSVYFQAVLSESQFALVRPGQSATVTVDAIAGRQFRGRVSKVFPVASAARSFPVRIDIPADPRLRPEMYGRGSILIDTHRGATIVPKDAVIFDPVDRKARLFVAQAGKASERSVQVGYTDPGRVEVVAGVRPGEQVIVAGQNALSDGDPVRVQ